MLEKAFKKYGKENFRKRIIIKGIIFKEIINDYEKEFIAIYRSIGKAEYNIANGGDGGSLKGKHRTEETRKKNSEAQKGKHLSEETRKKMSESRKGEKNHNFGKSTWNKGKKYHLNYTHSEETRKKISEAKKGNKNALKKLPKCQFQNETES